VAYVTPNFKTEKALVAVLKEHTQFCRWKVCSCHHSAQSHNDQGVCFPGGFSECECEKYDGHELTHISPVNVYQPGLGTVPRDGEIDLEGPHYPEPHRWYATGVMKDGRLVSVK